MLQTFRCLILLLSAVYAISAHAGQLREVLPGVGESIVTRGIKVTLLGVKRLSHEEYRMASGRLYRGWAGDGLRLAFFVENRPGAPSMPGLGGVRIFFGSQQYNAVSNSSSRDPFAPFIVAREPQAFLSTPFGRGVKEAVPTLDSQPSLGVLDVFIRGTVISAGTDGVVEIEQGETHRPDAEGRLRILSRREVDSSWIWFRFRLPPL